MTGTRKGAEAALAALLTQVNTGTGGHTGSDASVADLIEQWLDLKRDSLSVTTWEGYAGKARFRPIPALGKLSVRKLTVRDIDLFHRALAREEELAASTVRQIHDVLTGALDQAVRWGWRVDNPARLATLPSVRVVAAASSRRTRRPTRPDGSPSTRRRWTCSGHGGPRSKDGPTSEA